MNRWAWVTRPVLAGCQSLMLLIVPMVVPILVPLQMATPLPVLIAALRGGSRDGWIGVSIPLLGAMMLSDGLRLPLTAFGLFFAFPLFAAWLVRGGWRASHCLAGAFFLAVAVLLLVLFGTLIAGIDLGTLITLKMEVFKANLIAAIAKKGGDALFLRQITEAVDQFTRVLALLLPAFVLVVWFLLQTGNLLAARAVMGRVDGEGRFPPEDPAGLHLPFQLVWGVILSGALLYATEGFLRLLGANLLLLLAIPYFFQGLAIMQSGFRHHAIAGYARGFFYFGLVFFWINLVPMVTALGLFDSWIDFRKRFFST